jgi:hypothetical protein
MAVRRLGERPRGPVVAARQRRPSSTRLGDDARPGVPGGVRGAAGGAVRPLAAPLDAVCRRSRAARAPRGVGGDPRSGVPVVVRECAGDARRTRMGTVGRRRRRSTDRAGAGHRVAAARRGVGSQRPGSHRRRDSRGADRGRDPARRPGPVRRVRDRPAGHDELGRPGGELEWWLFGAFAGYVWWRWCRDELAEGAEVPSAT